ncbi:MAG TPA: tetratricopeptide repeat protein [Bacilli bacterium]|nr:tetratricopeptide repeat protein [Bacilli bacterium]
MSRLKLAGSPELGRKIQSLRLARTMTQIELAKGICTPSMISQIESGRAFPSYKVLSKIAEKLNVPIVDLTEGLFDDVALNVKVKTLKVLIESKQYQDGVKMAESILSGLRKSSYLVHEIKLSLSECLLWSGQLERAIEVLGELEQSNEHLNPQEKAKIYNLMGTAYFKKSDLLKAHSYYQLAYESTQKLEHEDIVTAKILYNLGLTYEWMDHLEDSAKYYSEAERIFKNSANSKRELANVFYAKAITLSKQEQLEKADEYLNMALSLYQSENYYDLVLKSREAHAYVVLSKKDPEKAKQVLLQCCRTYQEAGDTENLIYAYAKLAFICLENGKTTEADYYVQYIQSAMERDPTITKVDLRFGFIFRVFAQVAYETKNYLDAIKNANNSVSIFDTMGLRGETAKSLRYVLDSEIQLKRTESALKTSKRLARVLNLGREVELL